MRSKNTLKNMIASLSYEIMLIIFGLIAPKLIIDTYGSEVNGLSSTVHQILQILNLLQAGAVGASIFQMFKPVADKDYKKISIVLDASRKYFWKIGSVFLLLMFIIAPVMSLSTESDISVWEQILAFIILGLNGAFYFFFTSWFDILFSSHQKRFVLSIASIIDKLVYYGLLFAVIFMKLHFCWMYVVAMIGTISKIVYLYVIYKKEYKPKLVKVEKGTKFKIANKGYLLCNQIATQSVDSLPTVLITAMHGLKFASVYAVYNLVQTTIKMVVRTVQLSVSEVFGNLVVSEDRGKVTTVYNLLEFVFFIAAIVLCSCAMFLFMPFISLYSRGFDISYIYPVLAVVIVSYDLFYCMYMPCYTLTNVLGYYKETYLVAVIGAAVSAVIAVGMGFVDWTLVMLGPVFYYAISLVVRTYIAKKKVEWFGVGRFLRRIFVVMLSIVLSYLASQYVYSNGYAAGWIDWIIHAFVCGISVLVFVGIYVLIFERKELKLVLKYAKVVLKKK